MYGSSLLIEISSFLASPGALDLEHLGGFLEADTGADAGVNAASDGYLVPFIQEEIRTSFR